MTSLDLSGRWSVTLPDGSSFEAVLPGSLEENGIGEEDRGENLWKAGELQEGAETEGEGSSAPEDSGFHGIETRFTRRAVFAGRAAFCRKLPEQPAFPSGERLFLEAERSRILKLFVDGQEVPALAGSLSAPWLFEVTGKMGPGSEITLVCDNTYEGHPQADILNSSAATDETQTNWNGILGRLCLFGRPRVFVRSILLLPCGDSVQVHVRLDGQGPWSGTLTLISDAFEGEQHLCLSSAGAGDLLCSFAVSLGKSIRRFDEYEGNLYPVRAVLRTEYGPDTWEGSFGARDFGRDSEGRITLNGRRIFLRGETNCAVFPETGYEPVEEEAWTRVMQTYRSYGVNCVRFHSHCPPEAAFAAADREGILLAPELPMWNPSTAMTDPVQTAFYENELRSILEACGNHPSFVMLSMGNELNGGKAGRQALLGLVRLARSLDPTRLYADASNTAYGEEGCPAENGFFTAHAFRGLMLRATSSPMTGHLNEAYPGTDWDYSEAMEAVREEYAGPVFGFETGQYEVLPDFGETEQFAGIAVPENLRAVKERMEKRGLADRWERMVHASGELSRLCYQAEVEAVLRTPSMSGLFLLGLQDFPGQGTALVGMLNSHLCPKPGTFSAPERFASFFCERRILPYLPKHCFFADEEAIVPLRAANYGKTALAGPVEAWVCGGQENIRIPVCPQADPEERDGTRCFLPGTLSPAGTLTLRMGELAEKLFPEDWKNCGAARLSLVLSMPDVPGTETVLFVSTREQKEAPASVYVTERFDQRTEEVLSRGGMVYLSPPQEALSGAVRGCFSPNFWSVRTFPSQEGTMGLLIEKDHPLFRYYPTEEFGDWPWWIMAGRRVFRLSRQMDAILAMMDSSARLRPLAQMLECRCLGGRLLISSLALQDLQAYPECLALQRAVFSYMDTPDFKPRQELTPEEVKALLGADAC